MRSSEKAITRDDTDTETTVPSEPLYRTILTFPLPLPLYPYLFTLTLLPFPFPFPLPYPYPYRHERKSGCNVVLNDKKLLYSGVLGR